MEVEVRLLLGGHAPVTGDLRRYVRGSSGQVEEVIEPDTRVIRWDQLPTVTVDASDSALVREVFEDAFALIERDQGLVYQVGYHHGILFSLYSPGFEENVLAEMASEGTFGIDADGRLVLDDGRLRRLTIGDLRRAAESGVTSRDPHRLVAYEAWGAGSETAVGTITAFLNEHWEFLVPYTLSFVYRAVPSLRYRRVRRQVAQWQRQGIHDPWQIRTFLARRNEWTPSQVGKLVSLDDASAARLLKAMGYIRLDTGLYVLGETDEAKHRRDEWTEGERRAEL